MKKLPLQVDFSGKALRNAVGEANFRLGVLSGMIEQMPQGRLLYPLLAMVEAKDSAAIEKRYISYDMLYSAAVAEGSRDRTAEGILRHQRAILQGYDQVKARGYINTNMLITWQKMITASGTGLRQLPGTVLQDLDECEVIHRPPQTIEEIRELLSNLDNYINGDQEDEDPLIKMALSHYQFETIHPFYEGNGLTGRLLNQLYLVMVGRLSAPVLCLSKYFSTNGHAYYTLIRQSQESPAKMPDFVQYMVRGVAQSAFYTTRLIQNLLTMLEKTDTDLQQRLPKIYSAKLGEVLFREPCTKNELFQNELDITRTTATKYLKLLEKEGFLRSEQIGKEVIYKNTALLTFLSKWT